MEQSMIPQFPQRGFSASYLEEGAAKKIAAYLRKKTYPILNSQQLLFLCIGTDRSTGDALGPVVGTKLNELSFGYPVYGNLDEPIHAVNLKDTIRYIASHYEDPYIIAVDASLGRLKNVGVITVAEGPLRPGSGVNKELSPIGNLHITGVVNIGGFMEYFVLQNTRLSLVMKMADTITQAIIEAFRFSHPFYTSERVGERRNGMINL
ncbi:spore protease YyaC [Thermicanus aegyptius]|uniref:spore protease YyaC n=1 Tax=Thermicanus aegyptius TaxID=94009 RepID=UPI000490E57A|nr:spore protease YyaC [Thermicanus aegyptius]